MITPYGSLQYLQNRALSGLRVGWISYCASMRRRRDGKLIVKEGRTRPASAVIRRLRLQGWVVVAANENGSFV